MIQDNKSCKLQTFSRESLRYDKLSGTPQRHCLWKQCKFAREDVSFALGNWGWGEVNCFECDCLIQPVLIPLIP